jgi:hypothetical protein
MLTMASEGMEITPFHRKRDIVPLGMVLVQDPNDDRIHVYKQ